jgi:hypothetical protein
MASSAMGSNQHVVQNTRGPKGLSTLEPPHGTTTMAPVIVVVSRPEPFSFHGRILLSSDFHRSSNFDHDALADCPKVLLFLSYRKFRLPYWQSFFLSMRRR